MSGTTSEGKTDMKSADQIENTAPDRTPQIVNSIKEMPLYQRATGIFGAVALAFALTQGEANAQTPSTPDNVKSGDTQEMADARLNISPETVLKTPQPTPRPTSLPMRPTEAPQLVAAALPTVTPTPEAVKASGALSETLPTKPEVYVANIKAETNFRAGPGTGFAVVGNVGDVDREFKLKNYDPDEADLDSQLWLPVEGVLGKNNAPVEEAYFRADFAIRIRPVEEQDAGPNTGGAEIIARDGVTPTVDSDGTAKVDTELAISGIASFVEEFNQNISSIEVANAISEEAVQQLPLSLRHINQFLPESDRTLDAGTIAIAVIDGKIYGKMGNSFISWSGENQDKQLHSWYVLQPQVSSRNFQISVSPFSNPNLNGELGIGFNSDPSISKELFELYSRQLTNEDGHIDILRGIGSNSPENIRATTPVEWLGGTIKDENNPELFEQALQWADNLGVRAPDGSPFADAVNTQDRLSVLFDQVQIMSPDIKTVRVFFSRIPGPDYGWSGKTIGGILPTEYYKFDSVTGDLVLFIVIDRVSADNIAAGILRAISGFLLAHLKSEVPKSALTYDAPNFPAFKKFYEGLFVLGMNEDQYGFYPLVTLLGE